MFVYLLTLLLVNTCSLSFGNPVTNINGPSVSKALENLAKTCENTLLASAINSTVGQCRYDVAQKLLYTQKQQFECLLFLDINTQMCDAVAANQLNVLKEDMAKITQQMDVEKLCTSANNWKMLNLDDYPLYKITVDKVFSSEINCARACSVEDVTSQDTNFFCKYYKWGMELLARSNATKMQSADNIPPLPMYNSLSQPQQAIAHLQPILQQEPIPHQQSIPQQQPMPHPQPILQQQPIPHQQPFSQQRLISQQPISPQQLPGMPSEQGKINKASTMNTSNSVEVEAHSANAIDQSPIKIADRTQKVGESQSSRSLVKLDGSEVDEVSFHQSSSEVQNQKQQTKSTPNNAGISSQAQNSAQTQNTAPAAGGALNVDNTALENPSGAIALKNEHPEISEKPAQDKVDKEKEKNGKPQANPDVDYRDEDDNLNFGDPQGVDDTDPDNLGDVEDKLSMDQGKNIGAKTETLSSSNIMPDYSDDDEDHFFSFFLTVIIMVVLLYILYHNKNKVSKVFFGLILEGRQARRRNSRGHAYRRLDTLEQAMSTNSAAPPSKIIY